MVGVVTMLRLLGLMQKDSKKMAEKALKSLLIAQVLCLLSR